MTWSPNSTFATQLAAERNAPIFALSFDGWTTVYTTGNADATGWTYKAYLELIALDLGRHDIITGEIAFGELSFALVGSQASFFDLLASDKPTPSLGSLCGRRVTLRMGFAGFAAANWEVLGIYTIDVVKCSGDGTLAFTAIDPFPQFDREAFADFGDVTETAVVFDSSSTLPAVHRVESYEGFAVGDTVVVTQPSGAHKFTTITALRAETSTNPVKYWITTAADPTSSPPIDGASIKRVWYAEGHPVNLVARLMLDDWATTGAIQTDFPLTAVSGDFPSGSGLGVADDLLDTAQWKSERDQFAAGIVGRLVVSRGPERARTVVRAMLRGFGTFFMRRSGVLGFRALRLPLADAGTSPTQITHAANSAGWEWTRDFSDLYTVTIVKGNWHGDGELIELANIKHPNALTTYPGRVENVVESRWLWSDLNGEAVAELLAAQLTLRTATGPQMVTAQAQLRALTVEAGDEVLLTHPFIPDTIMAAAMTQRPAEVLNASADFATNAMQLEVMPIVGNRGGRITANTQVDYASASAAERIQYAFITQDDGTMPGGNSGYGWV